jgi:hypothetical protein
MLLCFVLNKSPIIRTFPSTEVHDQEGALYFSGICPIPSIHNHFLQRPSRSHTSVNPPTQSTQQQRLPQPRDVFIAKPLVHQSRNTRHCKELVLLREFALGVPPHDIRPMPSRRPHPSFSFAQLALRRCVQIGHCGVGTAKKVFLGWKGGEEAAGCPAHCDDGIEYAYQHPRQVLIRSLQAAPAQLPLTGAPADRPEAEGRDGARALHRHPSTAKNPAISEATSLDIPSPTIHRPLDLEGPSSSRPRETLRIQLQRSESDGAAKSTTNEQQHVARIGCDTRQARTAIGRELE